jgi:uncharacterized protein (DUF302 family)
MWYLCKSQIKSHIKSFHMNIENNGIISRQSKFSVKESLDRFQDLLAAKGITVFARIDQQAEARKVGLDMPPTEIIIFGNPKAGTPLMVAAPLAALDLPLKLLAWGHSDATTWLTYNDPEYLKQRYVLPADLVKKLDFGPLVDQIAVK